MRNSILYLFIAFMIIAAPRVFGDTDSNVDFNPFPQMEQDLSNTDNDAASAGQQQNEDDWPPANVDQQMNGEGGHE